MNPPSVDGTLDMCYDWMRRNNGRVGDPCPANRLDLFQCLFAWGFMPYQQYVILFNGDSSQIRVT